MLTSGQDIQTSLWNWDMMKEEFFSHSKSKEQSTLFQEFLIGEVLDLSEAVMGDPNTVIEEVD